MSFMGHLICHSNHGGYVHRLCPIQIRIATIARNYFSFSRRLSSAGRQYSVQVEVDQLFLGLVQRTIAEQLSNFIQQQFREQLPRTMQWHADRTRIDWLTRFL